MPNNLENIKLFSRNTELMFDGCAEHTQTVLSNRLQGDINKILRSALFFEKVKENPEFDKTKKFDIYVKKNGQVTVKQERKTVTFEQAPIQRPRGWFEWNAPAPVISPLTKYCIATIETADDIWQAHAICNANPPPSPPITNPQPLPTFAQIPNPTPGGSVLSPADGRQQFYDKQALTLANFELENKNLKLKKKKQELKLENKKLKKSLSEQKKDSKEALDYLKDQMNAKQDEIADLSSQLRLLRLSYRESTEEVNSLKDQLARANSDVNEAEQKYLNALVVNDNLKRDLDQAVGEKAALIRELASTKDRINELKLLLKDAEKFIDSIEHEHAKAKKEIEVLSKALTDERSKSAGLNKAIKDAESDLNEIEKLYQKAEDELANTLKSREADQKHITELETNLDLSQKKVASLKEELTSTNKTVKDLETQLKTAKDQATTITQERDDAYKQIETLATQLDQAKKSQTILEKNLKTAQALNALILKEHSEAKEQLANLDTKLIKTEQEKADLKNQLDTSKESNTSIQKDLVSTQETIKTLETKLEAAEEHVSSIAQKHDDATVQIETLAAQLDKTNNDKASLEKEIASAHDDINALINTHNQAIKIGFSLAAERDAARNEVETLTEKLETAHATADSLKEELANAELHTQGKIAALTTQLKILIDDKNRAEDEVARLSKMDELAQEEHNQNITEITSLKTNLEEASKKYDEVVTRFESELTQEKERLKAAETEHKLTAEQRDATIERLNQVTTQLKQITTAKESLKEELETMKKNSADFSETRRLIEKLIKEIDDMHDHMLETQKDPVLDLANYDKFREEKPDTSFPVFKTETIEPLEKYSLIDAAPFIPSDANTLKNSVNDLILEIKKLEEALAASRKDYDDLYAEAMNEIDLIGEEVEKVRSEEERVINLATQESQKLQTSLNQATLTINRLASELDEAILTSKATSEELEELKRLQSESSSVTTPESEKAEGEEDQKAAQAAADLEDLNKKLQEALKQQSSKPKVPIAKKVAFTSAKSMLFGKTEETESFKRLLAQRTSLVTQYDPHNKHAKAQYGAWTYHFKTFKTINELVAKLNTKLKESTNMNVILDLTREDVNNLLTLQELLKRLEMKKKAEAKGKEVKFDPAAEKLLNYKKKLDTVIQTLQEMYNQFE